MTSSISPRGPLPPRHRWKVLAAGVLANAAFSVAFSGIPMTAVVMRAGYRLVLHGLGTEVLHAVLVRHKRAQRAGGAQGRLGLGRLWAGTGA